MKLSMVLSSPTMTKIITLISTILLLAGLILLVSTTVKAVEVSDFEYIKYYSYNGFYYASLSDQPYTTYTTDTDVPADTIIDNNMGLRFEATKTQTWVSIKTFNSNLEQIEWNAYIAVYYPTGWELMNPFMVGSNVLFFPTNYEVTDLTGFPTLEFESLDDAIAEFENKLNATTSSTVTANNVQNQINSASEQWNSGFITIDEYEEIVNNGAETINELNNLSTNTIADQIAINNAQNTIAIAKDEINSESNRRELEEIKSYLFDFYDTWSMDHTISDKIKNSLPATPEGFQSFVTTTINDLQSMITQGTITINDAIKNLVDTQTLIGALSTQDFLTTADRGFLDQAGKTIEQYIVYFENQKDINSEISTDYIVDNNTEKEYLNDLTEETTDNINSLKSKVDIVIDNSDANMINNNVIRPILNNSLIKSLLPIAALFMVLAVTLGFKYRL